MQGLCVQYAAGAVLRCVCVSVCVYAYTRACAQRCVAAFTHVCKTDMTSSLSTLFVNLAAAGPS